MTHPWAAIYGVVIMWIAFSTAFYNLIKSKTEYKGNKQGDMDMGIVTVLAIFFGPILFLFLKPIRRYRKCRYLKRRIRYYKWQDNFHINIPPPPGSSNNAQPTPYVGEPMFDKEIKKMERILKISMLHQKSKRRKLLKWI